MNFKFGLKYIKDGNTNIDKIIQESQITDKYSWLRWIPYDNCQNIEHIANGGGRLEYDLIDHNVALKEIKYSRYDSAKFLNLIKTVNNYEYIVNYPKILLHKTAFLNILSIAEGLRILCEKNFVHYNLSRNLLNFTKNHQISHIDLDLDLILRGNEFTKKGDIYRFGGIIYEVATAQRPFADQAHDTYLMMDICNVDFFWIVREKLYYNIVDKLFELFSHSSKLHSQSCYIIRSIHTLHGLQDLLDKFKSGKSSDPNILKSNESTTINADTYFDF
ncbi:hypothetical protein Glove_233g20 [Diversispora epigaea]|uniref:Protein kinase domain-containing protein n=1 Tax=Diversispora epigaea TaxID=1348612 RepID=A0A397IJ25_9GLOM|nr:hypothetical protein Glove_233g20 [Diversispora epigaea]